MIDLKCKSMFCDEYLEYDDLIGHYVCRGCGAIGDCQKDDCEGLVIYTDYITKCKCNRCGTEYDYSSSVKIKTH